MAEEKKETTEQKPEINLDLVKTFLTDNDEGKSYLQDLLQSHGDSVATKAITTFKTETLPGLIDTGIEEKYTEKHPDETAEAKLLREIQKDLKATKLETIREKLLNKALKSAESKGLPVGIVENLLGDDETITEQNITSFDKIFKDAVNKAVEAKLKGTGRSDFVPEGDTKGLTPESILAMSKEDRAKLSEAVIEKVLKTSY